MRKKLIFLKYDSIKFQQIKKTSSIILYLHFAFSHVLIIKLANSIPPIITLISVISLLVKLNC